MIRQSSIVLAALGLMTSIASADVTFSFVTGQNTYNALPGEEVLIPIYLQETLTGASTSQIAAQNGLYSFGFTLERTSGDGQILAVDRNSAFDRRDPTSTTTFPANPAKLWAEQDVNFGNGVVPDGAGLIHLATLRFEAPLLGDASFSISDFGPGAQTVTYTFSELDPLIATGNFTVTTVIPEPSIAMLLAVGAAGLLRRRRARAL